MPPSLEIESSAAEQFVLAFVRGSDSPEVAVRVLLAAWRQLPMRDRAAVALDWRWWARPKQWSPDGPWKTWGFLTGRGFGKTVAVSHFILGEIAAGRAPLVCLLAQDEQSSIDLQVLGPSGLMALSPPWARPTWEATAQQLTFPNGARAYVRTPEVPGKIRGLEYHLTWASEIQSWPSATREEALDNAFLSTRLGLARLVWDATPKRRHPLLKKLLASVAERPDLHRVVRGATYENAANLGDGYVGEMERKFGGTLRGREELLGEMLEDAELSLFRQTWIDQHRTSCPRLVRRVVSIDPAVTNRRGSDNTGLIEAGLGADGRAYVLSDASGKHDAARWGEIALSWYVDRGCDLIVAETNKGGELVTQNLRSLAEGRGLTVEVIDKDKPRPPRTPGKVWVKEVYARGAKEDRAEPVATAYERGRASHVAGADLASLEDTMTSWEPAPGADSPGDLDALVHAVSELLGLAEGRPDPRAGFVGIEEVARQVRQPDPPASLSRSLSGALRGRPDRI